MFNWFEKQLDPFPSMEPKQPPKSLIAFCRYFTRGAWKPIFIMAALTAAIALIEVSLYAFLGDVVDWLSESSRETFFVDERDRLIRWGLIVLVGLPALALGVSLVQHQTLLGNYPMRIRWLVHRYLLRQSMDFFQNEFSGRIATKVMQTALAVRESVLKVLDVLNYVGVYFVGALVIAGSEDLRMLGPMLCWFLLYIGLLRYFIPRMRRVSEEQAGARATMTGRIVDSYTNIATIKLFSHSAREESFARAGMHEFLGTVHRQMRIVTVFWMSLYCLNVLFIASASLLAIYLWTLSAVTIGAAATAIGVALRLQGISQWIMWEVSALFENIGTVQDGMSSISQARVVSDSPDAKELQVAQGQVQLEDVSFHYGKGAGIIDSLNLNIKAGERVGIVGRSGAGKSTVVSLLLRFYDVEAGRITIDGQDVSKVTQESLRASIGVVSQDTSLLHRSVRDNVLYGSPEASEERMLEATGDAEAHEFILGLRDVKGRTGYDAHVGERGVTLSGGQRQRIAIARVMLKDAPIVVLDEATSALDSEVEEAIQESLSRLMRGKTVIAIAHRLSTIAALDRLIVLDRGRVVEDGTHDELIAGGGLYAELWARQSGGFLGVEEPSS